MRFTKKKKYKIFCNNGYIFNKKREENEVVDLDFTANPLKSATTATNTTIVYPILTGAIWRVNVFYYVGA